MSSSAGFSFNPQFGCLPLVVDFTNESDGQTFTGWAFGNGNSSNMDSPTQTFDESGNYTIKLLVESQNGCKDSITKNVTVFPNPIVDFTPVTDDPCGLPFTTNFQNTSQGAIDFQWDFDDGNTSQATNPSNTYTVDGVFDVSLIGVSINGCADRANHLVEKYTPAVANITFQQL